MPIPNSIDELSTNPAENYPAGTEPVFPGLDNYIRFHAACIAQLRDEVSAGGLPLGGSMWWGGARSKIKSNFKPEDGDLLLRADYPALWQFVQAGGYPLVSEADWWADKSKRASFSSGDGATTFRIPDNNGKQKDSFGAVVKRGDGALSAGAPGLTQDSQNLRHTHPLSIVGAGAHTHEVNDPGHEHAGGADTRPDGVDYVKVGQNPYYNGRRNTSKATTGVSIASAGWHTHSGSAATEGGAEARGVSTTGCHVMRVK